MQTKNERKRKRMTENLKTCSTCEHGEDNSGYCLECYAGFKHTEKQCESKREITNYDRIRKMSIEELAEFMYSAPDKICFENCVKDTGNKFSCKFGEGVDISNCLKCMKIYLKSEVTE